MARISLRGLCRLIWVDTLRRVYNVGFLVGRFIYECVITVRIDLQTLMQKEKAFQMSLAADVFEREKGR